MPAGYYRHPTITGDTVVFVTEDDLWSVPASGGTARRLTANLGEVSHPLLSPDGRTIAFASKEEGPVDIYTMPAGGGPAKRLTYMGGMFAKPAAWVDGGLVVASSAQQYHFRMVRLVRVPAAGGLPEELRLGPAITIAYGPRRARVLQRFGQEPAWWKRYRGGRMGALYIDPGGKGKWRRLIELNGTLTNPMWIGARVHFLSDHEGVANLYSCTPEGRDLKRHTRHVDHYARHATTDGKRIVYHAGGDVWLFDGKSSRTIEIDLPSPRVQRKRRFADAGRFLEDYAPHDKALAVVSRGRLFKFAPFDGPVDELGTPRMRLARWTNDGNRLIAVTDQGGEESLVVHPGGQRVKLKRDIGRAIDMKPSPAGDRLAVANHRQELVVVDLKSGRTRVLDTSRWDRIAGFSWSPDGSAIAYSLNDTINTYTLKLVDVKSGKSRAVMRPLLRDVAPVFDPEGRYLYFLGWREFDPVYDNVGFDLGFPRGARPYLVTLRADQKSPFTNDPPEPPKNEKAKKKDKFRIDLDGIESRVIAFPVPEGRYGSIDAVPGAALWTIWPVDGALNQTWLPGEQPPRGLLEKWDFAKRKKETLVNGVSSFRVGGRTMVYRSNSKLRWVKAGEKPDEKSEKDPPGRDSGWIDLSRLKPLVEPPVEWAQILREAWRLMRDHFWVADMSKVDWGLVWKRYRPLVDRVGSRSEFSDLVWEMQGELATSHCYEFGGDYRPEPRYDVGLLGAEFAWDKKGWRVARVVAGDAWDERGTSPLSAPGVGVKAGDVIVAINGRACAKDVTPNEMLLNRADQEVALTLASKRTVTVRTLRDEMRARYREWVETNRRAVHEKTKGRVGYVHVPDMGPAGFAEFHRGYYAEVAREAMIVDVRNNGGGHVSQLLLEKLARKRVGFDVSRWRDWSPYPSDSPAGPLVALTNENAGSDGDIFSHCFKLFGLGPLIGRRTWGGVIGIWPRHLMADGSVTTQPEFSFWFKDVGFGVENYGTDPDIDVDILPHDYAAGRDPQLERGIATALELLRKHKPLAPDESKRPNLALPKK